jgi:hypothetical protein
MIGEAQFVCAMLSDSLDRGLRFRKDDWCSIWSTDGQCSGPLSRGTNAAKDG